LEPEDRVKKLFTVLAYLLALNFLFALGGAGYLWRGGHLNRQRLAAIGKILFPPPTPSAKTAASAAASAAGPATQPTPALEDLLKQTAGRSAQEQVAFLQHAFDARMAQLDLRKRQLDDQQTAIDLATQRLAQDRAALEAQQKQITAAQQQAAAQASDQGFQDSLQLYSVMPPQQVKTIFMSLDLNVVVRYLQAMDPGTAAKIIKQFKTPVEIGRIQKVLERMRQDAPAAPTTAAATAPPTAGTPGATGP
jgi:hypothetical protein